MSFWTPVNFADSPSSRVSSGSATFAEVYSSDYRLIMVAVSNRADHYIFALWFLLSFFLSFFFLLSFLLA